ncbi:MAG: response regulator transcription factor [Mariprofundaceae bacterium]
MEDMNPRIRNGCLGDNHILLVGDDIVTRNCVALMLQKGGLSPVNAVSPEAALDILNGNVFSLVLIDLPFSEAEADADGFDLVHQLHEQQPTCPVIIITADHRAETAVMAIRLHVDDYLLKPLKSVDFLAAVHQQLSQAEAFNPTECVDGCPDEMPETFNHAPLTRCERKVLKMFYKGYSYKETARLLGCCMGTVQTHAKHIYKKMGVHSRTEATHEALSMHLID